MVVHATMLLVVQEQVVIFYLSQVYVYHLIHFFIEWYAQYHCLLYIVLISSVNILSDVPPPSLVADQCADRNPWRIAVQNVFSNCYGMYICYIHTYVLVQ